MLILFIGLEDICKEVNSDTSIIPISSLISEEEQEHRTIYFVHGEKLFPVLKTFPIFFKESYSVITDDIWKSTLEKLKHVDTLSIIDVEDKIWNPVITNCKTILKSIESKTITLKEVHRIHELCAVRENNVLFEQIIKLYNAVIKCNQFKPSKRSINFDIDEPKWIRESVNHMQRFLEQRKFVNSAKALLNVKEKLELKMNFDAFEKVAESIDDNILDKPLNYIAKTIEVVPFLKRVTLPDEVHRQSVTITNCLQKFCECFAIVNWIKSEIKGM